ncbi:ABC transporter permease family protein [Citrobacter amalonaticus]|uniref:ABC transporter permease subunit n=1 Tax=Citrobacter amalonaticus TaxID=35703 RepID=UPI00178862CD|nr:ABC transporter permease subunit [Citrobacter amalonaticus]MBE0396118.1 ABC transporter permease subunit [Citrobacter amalonaticus]HCD7966965.1 ABC transporter permease subunit [Citrobacter amalonaticus]
MAAPLRIALMFLAWLGMAAIYAPILPAGMLLIAPALSLANWQALFTDPQLPQALLATVVSVFIAAAGALFIALTIVVALWPGLRWRRLSTRLPWLLAIPHVAFASAALLLFAEGGLLWHALPFLSPAIDRYGIGLGVTLAVKESAFVLWILSILLSEKRLAQQVIVLDSLGYNRRQTLCWLILPTIAPALGAVMLAVVAWTISAVDVAIILGPGNPPTLAVLSWQWLSQGDSEQQIKGALASLLLLALLALFALAGYQLWRSWRRTLPDVSGVRQHRVSPLTGKTLSLSLPATGVLCTVLLAFLAQQSTLNLDALTHSVTIGVAASALGLVILLLWLEWGPQRGHRWVWLPILLPALPLVMGQYALALHLELDGQFASLIWGHLLWVVPWMLFVLKPAWQRIDPRLLLIARTLGWSPMKIFCCVKCPQILRPVLVTLAVGFSVSIAQYMPTLWLGAGRFPTLTTEAVALSSGGSTGILAAQALWQLLLPLVVFTLMAGLSLWVGHRRQGLR